MKQKRKGCPNRHEKALSVSQGFREMGRTNLTAQGVRRLLWVTGLQLL
jgi:hypothetical protein